VAILYVGFSFYSIWSIIQITLQFTILRCRLEACGLPSTASPPVTVLRHTQGVPTEECWYFQIETFMARYNPTTYHREFDIQRTVHRDIFL